MSDFGKLNWNVSLKPTTAFPLDARCYFESKADADAAAATAEEAGSTNTIYYYGQKLVVVANGVATWYTIQPNKTLKKDGSGDENTNSFSGSFNDLTDVPETFEPAEHNHTITALDGYDEVAEAIGKQISDAVEDVTEIASGKCDSYVFDTVDDLDTAITEYLQYAKDGTEMSAKNVLKGANLKTGDVFLIRAVDVPDYWWDGTANKKQILETTKVDLSVISNEEIDEILKL